MSHFYGSMQGNKGEATRCGTKKSGIECHVRGWEIGVKVSCEYNHDTEKNEIYIYKTGGSDNPSEELIKKITE